MTHNAAETTEIEREQATYLSKARVSSRRRLSGTFSSLLTNSCVPALNSGFFERNRRT
jgi:hypothetical protein